MKSRTALFGLLAAASTTTSSADFVHAPISVSSPFGEQLFFPLANIINQSGLSDNYISGETDFASYTATTTHSPLLSQNNVGFTNTSSDGPQHFTFDLGDIYPVTSIAIWNTDSEGAVSSFELYADDDNNLDNGTTARLIEPTNLQYNDPLLSIPAEAQVFSFETISVRYIHVNGLSTLLPPDYYSLAEVVFGVVPAPSASLVGAVTLCGLSRRRRV